MPLYNKFRAVSSIQVILEICMPALALMGLQSFFKAEEKEKWNALWKSAAVTGGILVVLLLAKGMFSFAGGSDGYLGQTYGPEFVDALKADRKSMYTSDLLRSGLFILLAFGALYLTIKNTISSKAGVVVVGILMVADLFLIDRNYVNAESFVNPVEVDEPFVETSFDAEIRKDKSHYRVFEVSGDALMNARTSYFHKSIGGYSAVKPKRMEQLFDYQITKNNMQVLNMLNVKYLIQTNEKGEQITILNTQANGNAWFVNELKFVRGADAEMKALDKLDTKNVAILDLGEYSKGINLPFPKRDASAKIELIAYEPDDMKYVSNNPNEGYAVFSEMYYKNGWNAYIDGKPVNHDRVNYALRGLRIPAGKHNIDFKFEPQVVKTGSTIALISFVVMFLLIGGGVYLNRKKIAS